MATINLYPFVRHITAAETSYLRHLDQGRLRRTGTGASFWFRALNSTISEVPIDDREQDVLAAIRTTDFQVAHVPGTITYRFADPELAAARVDFSVNLVTGNWKEQPLESVGAMLDGALTAAVRVAFAQFSLAEALRVDPDQIRSHALAMLAADPRLASLGIEVIGVRFGLVRPEPDVERALQTPARETIQQDADRATFERRALAVEREAAIGQNELASQIELARRNEDLIAQQGTNQRREAEQSAAAALISTQAEAERTTQLAEAEASATRMRGAAAVGVERERIEALQDSPREVLMALMLRELAGQLPAVEHLVITPDLLSGLLAKLTGNEA